MDILQNFCSWWWAWWIIPAILGWLLGTAMMMKWKTRTEELETEVSNLKKKISGLEEDLEACRKRGDELEADLNKCRAKYKDLERRFSSLQGKYNDLESENIILKTKVDDGSNDIQKIANVKNVSPVVKTETPPPPPPKPPVTEAAGIVAGTAGTGKWAKLKTDNLQIIEGIGPKMNTVLNENGITDWSVLAGSSLQDLKAILAKYGDKYKIIDPSDWAKQASFAAAKDWEGLMKHQSDDGSPSKARKLLVKLGIINEEA